MKNQTEEAESRAGVARCLDCRFWVQYVNGKEEPIYGECHRLPPASQRVPLLGHASMFPNVFEWVKNWPRPDADDVCGEYQPNQPSAAAKPMEAIGKSIKTERDEARKIAAELRDLVKWDEAPPWVFPWENAQAQRPADENQQ